MCAEELYTALKEIKKTTATERERLVQALVKRLMEYPNAD